MVIDMSRSQGSEHGGLLLARRRMFGVLEWELVSKSANPWTYLGEFNNGDAVRSSTLNIGPWGKWNEVTY